MRAVVEFIGGVTALIVLVTLVRSGNDELYVPPPERLKAVTGVVDSVNKGGRKSGACVMVRLWDGALAHTLSSRDCRLREELKPGMSITATVYPSPTRSEIWGIQSETGVRRSFEETQADLKATHKSGQRIIYFITALIALLLAASTYRRFKPGNSYAN
jgi:hypothetical protein